jgi:nucleoside-diphosphate-sugar epimerase
MTTTIFVAGATGAIGRRLAPLLLSRGHRVVGMTRSQERASVLADMGALPVICDVFDAPTLRTVLQGVRPDVVVHQLTDLPRGLDASRMEEGIRRNARIRIEGTENLVAAAAACGASHVVAQSIAWAYAPGPKPHAEESPLDEGAHGLRGVSVGGVIALERVVLHTPGLRGTVLRYGQIYGPGTGSDDASGKPLALHVDAAAWAAMLAVELGRTGIFNIVEPNSEVTSDKARRELGWHAATPYRASPEALVAN